MRGKPVSSGERVIICNVFKYMKSNYPLESKRTLISRTVEATGSSISTIKRIIKDKEDEERPRTPGKKRPNRKKFSKLDEFDLSVIRRIVHSFYARNEGPTLKKLLKKLKEEIGFPYGRTHLYELLKTMGFKYKKRGREGIVNERSDLIVWRESFLRHIKDVREKEPEREIVYTDETWLNADHRVKKEWVDLKALENPRRSIQEFGTVGCTKDKIGKGKRIIIVDCMTENGPVPGALWIFSPDSKSQKREKQEISFEETAVTIEKAEEIADAVGEQESGSKNVPSSSMPKPIKRKSKVMDPPATSKKAKKETETKDPHQRLCNNTDGEDTAKSEVAGIMENFDYHDTMNAENYEKYFEKVCTLLKPNSLIVIDNASYHSRNTEDFPVSRWRKGQFQEWLKENNISFPSDALRSELWILCKTHRNEKISKVVEQIAKKYGHEVLRLPPYHCELNAIELIWADEKNFVARENKEMTIESVENLFRKRREEITAEICRNCVKHVRRVEEEYWETDRIMDEKTDRLIISLGDSEDESDIETDNSSTDDDDTNEVA